MTKNIAEALLKAQSEVQAVAKASTNKFHNYKYASAESVIEEARDCLIKAGLVLICSNVARVDLNETESKLHIEYMLIHALTGDSHNFESETTCVPEKGRPQDKAEACALTYNLSYFLRGLLLMPREEENASVDARDDREKKVTNELSEDDAVKLIETAPNPDALKNAGARARVYANNPRVRTAFQKRTSEFEKAV